MGVVGLGVGVASVLRLVVGVGNASFLRLGVGVGVGVGAVVTTGPGIWFKMRPRSARYHAFTYTPIVDMSAAIKNVRLVFLFLMAMLVLRRSSLTSCFVIN